MVTATELREQIKILTSAASVLQGGRVCSCLYPHSEHKGATQINYASFNGKEASSDFDPVA